jgi:transcription initiation factor TFIIIB Brf1 subunit/transcription initiation factor TFIIB
VKCPYCNSIDLVYDFEKGYVVCKECGTVIETIFVEQFLGVAQEYVNDVVKSVKNAMKFKRAYSYRLKLSEYVKEVNRYEDFVRRCRKNVKVDLDAIKIVANGGKARVYRHVNDDGLKKLVKEDEIIGKILEVLEEDAILSSRTFRSKVALALLIKDLITHGEADIDEIAHKTSVSKVHMQRLVKVLKNRMRNLKLKLTEVKNLASYTISVSS